jgi:hypothetical protein
MDMAMPYDDARRPPRVNDRPWDLDDRALPPFTAADLHELKRGQRRLCEQMGAVTVERTGRLVVAIGVRHGRWIALRWTEGRLNGLAFSTRLGSWGSWTNITDCAPRFARALLLDEDPVLRGRLLADMVKLDLLDDQAP